MFVVSENNVSWVEMSRETFRHHNIKKLRETFIKKITKEKLM